MKWSKGIVMAVTVSTVLWGGTAFGAGVGPRGGQGGWAILRSLGLSDGQKAQVHEIFANHRSNLRTLHAQLRTARQELGDKLYGNPPTAADLAPISQLRDQVARERLQIALEIRNILTPDQLAKAAQVRQQLEQLRLQRRNLLEPGA